MSETARVLEALIRRRGAELGGRVRDQLERVVKRAAPVSAGYPGNPPPGRLRDSVEVAVRFFSDRLVFSVRATAPHAIFTIVSTRLHVIRPRRQGGVLVFYWPEAGGTVFFRSVHHPGTTPSGWWEQALAQFSDVVREAL
jgi:hypothetical protein